MQRKIVIWCFLSPVSSFWKNGSRLTESRCWMCPRAIKFWIPEPDLMKLGTLVSWHLSHSRPLHSWIPPISQYLCTCVSHPNVARQRLSEYFLVKTNTHATAEELLDSVFSMRSVRYRIRNILWKESRLVDVPRNCYFGEVHVWLSEWRHLNKCSAPWS
jgi:hypothetical protein